MAKLERSRRMLAIVSFLTLAWSSANALSADRHPYNVLIVTVDTLRADRLGVYGYSKIQTPNLDRLASSGVLFENAVAQAPLTPPSHASIFTGTYPTVHQVRDTGSSVLDSSHLTLAEILQQQGWETAAFVGAAVLGRVFGLDQGFQTYDDQINQDSSPDKTLRIGLAVSRSPSRRAGEVVDRACKWLRERSKEKPYFLWVHVFDPHTPYDPPSPFKEMYKSPYDGEIAYVDRELGRLLDNVTKGADSNSTLIAVLSDHGESLGEHGEYTHGVFLYESTLHIPWIMVGPEVPGGVRVNQQVRTIDLVPTLLSLLGIDIPSVCQGVSLVPAFSGKRTGSTYAYSETLHPKIHMGWAELRAIRSNKWKYIRAPRSELYDLENDPEESENVISRHPTIARRLENQLREITSFGVPGMPEQVQLTAVDQETEARLRSLGYVSAGSTAPIGLTGEGVDPKDRVHVLQLLEEATTTAKQVSPLERIRLLEEALKEDPGSSLLFQVLGEKYEENNRDDDALRLFQRAVQQDVPAKGKLYARMAILYGQKGRLQESIDSFEKAVAIDPTDLETQNRLAGAYLLNQEFDQAERIAKGVLVLNEVDAQAHSTLGWIAMQRGRNAEARQHFAEALHSNPDFLEAYLNLGMLHKKLGETDQAKQAFETFLAKAAGKQEYEESILKVRKELTGATTDKKPGDGAVAPSSEEWLLKGTALIESDELSEALDLFNLQKQSDPLDPRGYFYSGMVLSQLNKLTAALEDLKESVRLGPDVLEYTVLYANVLAQQGHDKLAADALVPFQRTKVIEGLNAAWIWLLFDTHYRTGKYDEALYVLGVLSQKAPDDPRIPLSRGKVYFARGDLESAETALDESVRKQPDNNPEAYYYLGRLHQKLSQMSDAKQAFSSAAKQDPDSLEYVYQLGATCLALGESKNAIRYLQQAESGGIGLPDVYQLLGRAYSLQKDETQAKEYLEKFQAVRDLQQEELRRKVHSERLVGLGEEALKLGDAALARRLLEEAVEVDGNNWAARGYLAEMCLEKREFYEAYEHLVKMEEIDPDAAAGKYMMAQYWYWQRDYVKASEYAGQVKQIRPSHPELRNLLGNIYLALDRIPEAIAEYSAAVELAPDRSEFLLNLETARKRVTQR